MPGPCSMRWRDRLDPQIVGLIAASCSTGTFAVEGTKHEPVEGALETCPAHESPAHGVEDSLRRCSPRCSHACPTKRDIRYKLSLFLSCIYCSKSWGLYAPKLASRRIRL